MDSYLPQLQSRVQDFITANSSVTDSFISLTSTLTSVDFSSKPVLYGAIGVVVFLFLLLFGLARHHMLSWSMKGAVFGILFGIVLTLIAEAFLLTSATKALVGVLQSNATPQNVRVFLQDHLGEILASVSKETETLGVSTSISSDVVAQYRKLPNIQQNRIKEVICTPKR